MSSNKEIADNSMAMKHSPSSSFEDSLDFLEQIVILDFGSQYSHLIVRRLREAGVYSVLKSCDISCEDLQKLNYKGVIFSGGPCSVYEEGSPHISTELWNKLLEEETPMLGICYGLQEMMNLLGGTIAGGTHREFGAASLVFSKEQLKNPDPLFEDVIKTDQTDVWMSHSDSVVQLAKDFKVIASTSTVEIAAIVSTKLPIWGVQFHPEVTHTKGGKSILQNFALKACMINESWSMSKFVELEIRRLRNKVGSDKVIGAVSGGVDSTVAACITQQALGNQFHAIFVNNGLLRKDEAEEVPLRLKRIIPDLQLRTIDASEEFYATLKGVQEPEEKRVLIGRTFIEVFEKSIQHTVGEGKASFLLQGTLYPDVIESVSLKGHSHKIKTHHNVGGLPEKMKLQLLEPLRELFKDEVRELGKQLGIEMSSVWRHPFPGPGLAVRIIGDITPDRVKMLQLADSIFLEELRRSGIYDEVSQAFVVLLPEAQSVGVMGDTRTYEATAVLRSVNTHDFMTAETSELPYSLLKRVSSRIINEVPGINRICYDISSKPPATIEWE